MPANALPILRNAAAGGGAPDDELRAALAEAGMEADLRAVPPGELANEARRLFDGGAAVVGVSGGDGTVSTVAGALAGTGARLAVFPGGTLNHFAAALGIHTHEEAVRALRAGRFQAVDVGRVNGRVFVNGASIGLYPRQLRLRESWQGRIGKWPAALLAGLLTLAAFPRRHVVLEGGSTRRTRVAPLVWIGPGRGSFRDPVADPRELDSGVLEVVVVGAASRLRLLELGLRAALHGRDALRIAREATDCEVHLGERFTISTRRGGRMDVGVDGELVRLDAPLEFEVLARALHVCVAQPAPRDGQGAAEGP